MLNRTNKNNELSISRKRPFLELINTSSPNKKMCINKTKNTKTIAVEEAEDPEENASENVEKKIEEIMEMLHNLPQNKPNVFKTGNHIYFTDNVSTTSINQLVRLINKTTSTYKNFVSAVSSADIVSSNSLKIKPLYLHINSLGGELVDGFRAMDLIATSSVPIYTVIEGEASSAASLMFSAGKKRFMTANSVMLIHQLRSSHGGTYESCKDDQKNNDLFHNKMVEIYFTKMCGTMTKKQIEKALERDIYWDYETCKKYNLVDELYTGDGSSETALILE